MQLDHKTKHAIIKQIVVLNLCLVVFIMHNFPISLMSWISDTIDVISFTGRSPDYFGCGACKYIHSRHLYLRYIQESPLHGMATTVCSLCAYATLAYNIHYY